MKYITQSKWDKTPEENKIFIEGEYFLLNDKKEKEEVLLLMDKRKKSAFDKEVYLLGKDKEGVYYWLEEAKWEITCSPIYWGFGYIESYTNNKQPQLSKDISSHQHATDFMSKWFTEWNGTKPILYKTTFTKSEGWELSELFKAFYHLQESAHLYEMGSMHISKSEAVSRLKDVEFAGHINKTQIKPIIDRIIGILSPKL